MAVRPACPTRVVAGQAGGSRIEGGLRLRRRPHPERVTAEWSEAAKPAGQHDDLLVLPGPAQRIEHALNAVVVAIHEGVIENDRSRLAALGERRAHGKPHQHRDLLLGAILKPLERLRPLPLDARARVRRLGTGDVGFGNEPVMRKQTSSFTMYHSPMVNAAVGAARSLSFGAAAPFRSHSLPAAGGKVLRRPHKQRPSGRLTWISHTIRCIGATNQRPSAAQPSAESVFYGGNNGHLDQVHKYEQHACLHQPR
jgi:hypothetical protein